MTLFLPRSTVTTVIQKAIVTRSTPASITYVREFQHYASHITTPLPRTQSSLAGPRPTVVRTFDLPSAVPRRSRCTSNNTIGGANLASTSTKMNEPAVHELFEPVTGSWQYVVADPSTSSAVIIDPVLNYDAARSAISTESADALIKLATEKDYKIEMILETHIHADHITAASYIQTKLAKSQGHKPLIGIGSRIKDTQKLFGERYGIAREEYSNVFDRMWEDDQDFNVGSVTARAIHLPGHTPDHMGYKIGSKCSGALPVTQNQH